MASRTSFVLNSYLKTTISCLALCILAVAAGISGVHWLPSPWNATLASLSVCAFISAGIFTSACTVVLIRYARAIRGKRDLFLDLNRSREPEAIQSQTLLFTGSLHRWFARRLLGHDLIVGDLIEVKSWEEISATLDERGCLDGLPFVPEMLAMCGKRTRVFRCVHRIFDYRKSRRMRHMDHSVLLVGTVCDGSSHGGCEARCHTIWKSSWLRKIERTDRSLVSSADQSSGKISDSRLEFGTQGPRYVCQLTQLHAASEPITKWSLKNFLLPVISGNVAPLAFVVGWLTHLFNELQQKRGGIDFPVFENVAAPPKTDGETLLKPGDEVVVRPAHEIRATLNEQMMHRGLWFEPDMLKHCSQRHRVQTEVRKVIDIVSGEMLTMKTPSYVLQNVHFSGERQLFNAQYEPLFWRSAWLRPDTSQSSH